MMLDSSLGKILATKPVEPSISKEDAVANPTKPEAEVRIVFRFFVEEQIVFNGKIEKVKQLESEELSRIVSRIAWDGAKDEKKPLLDKEPIKNDDTLDCTQKDEPKQGACNETPHSSDNAPKQNNADSSKKQGSSEESVYMDCSSFETNDLAQSDSVPEVGTLATKTIQSSPSVDPPIVTPKSDRHTTAHILDHVYETGLQSDSSYQVQEIDKQQPQDDRHQHQDNKRELVIDTDSPDIQDSSAAAEAEAAAAAAESQMIVEALYDCVYNVDLESRKSEQDTISKTDHKVEMDAHEMVEDGYKKSSQGSTHVEQTNDTTSRENTKPDKRPLTEAANVPSNNDISQKTNSSSDVNYFGEKEAQTQQACKDDLNLRLENNKKPDMNLAGRRRNTCDIATPNRRVRRSGSKDQRTLRISSSDKLGENTLARQGLDQNEGSFQSGENLTRHCKVFAKWSDNHFYPGTILKPAKDRKFEIGFFDGAHKDVVETDLIPLSNIIHKQVRVSIAKDYCVNALVHDKQTATNGQPMFDVEYQQNGLVKKCVPLKDIFLTAEQGIPLINQPIRPDKNPDESMFAGVDLDNIVHNKRSRRLQELEDLEAAEELPSQVLGTPNLMGGRRKRGQYNMRNTTNRARANTNRADGSSERSAKRFHSYIENQDTPISSCSPDNLKPHLHISNSNPPSESSSSTGSTNSASNVHETSQEFYFESSSPHRTKTSLLL